MIQVRSLRALYTTYGTEEGLEDRGPSTEDWRLRGYHVRGRRCRSVTLMTIERFHILEIIHRTLPAWSDFCLKRLCRHFRSCFSASTANWGTLDFSDLWIQACAAARRASRPTRASSEELSLRADDRRSYSVRRRLLPEATAAKTTARQRTRVRTAAGGQASLVWGVCLPCLDGHACACPGYDGKICGGFGVDAGRGATSPLDGISAATVGEDKGCYFVDPVSGSYDAYFSEEMLLSTRAAAS